VAIVGRESRDVNVTVVVVAIASVDIAESTTGWIVVSRIGVGAPDRCAARGRPPTSVERGIMFA
jgi:hypothetical protein